jgi:hypothetical protein
MKRVLILLFALAALSPVVAYAHGGHDHVRGTVAQINGQSIVVQTSGKATKTITVLADTKFEKAGKPAALADLKVGDRVVIDCPEGKLTAEEIKIGTAQAAEAHDHAEAHEHK